MIHVPCAVHSTEALSTTMPPFFVREASPRQSSAFLHVQRCDRPTAQRTHLNPTRSLFHVDGLVALSR